MKKDGAQAPNRDDAVIVERRRSSMLLWFNRPAARNALNFESWNGLEGALQEIERDPTVRCLILCGMGDFFSSGGDMKSLEPLAQGVGRHAARLSFLHRVLVRLRAADVATIAAVEGGAVGVAWSMALSCDFLVVAKDATFRAPFRERGLVPDGGMAWHLSRTIGPLRATQFLLANGVMPATQAFEYGLATSVTEPGAALEKAIELAGRLEDVPRDTLALTLKLLRGANSQSYDDFLASELAAAMLNSHKTN